MLTEQFQLHSLKLTMTLAVGNLSARNLELTPTEHPMSRMSPIIDVCECCRWCCSIALSQLPRIICVASSTDEAVGIARLTIDLVAASASAAAYHHIKQILWYFLWNFSKEANKDQDFHPQSSLLKNAPMIQMVAKEQKKQKTTYYIGKSHNL